MWGEIFLLRNWNVVLDFGVLVVLLHGPCCPFWSNCLSKCRCGDSPIKMLLLIPNGFGVLSDHGNQSGGRGFWWLCIAPPRNDCPSKEGKNSFDERMQFKGPLI